MKRKILSFIDKWRNDGAVNACTTSLGYLRRTVVTSSYNIIRPRLPRLIGIYNGVIVRDLPPLYPNRGALRSYLAGLYGVYRYQQPFHHPEYEDGLVQGLQRYIVEGDDVVIVGGGRGVTAVLAERETGENGSVTVYEASTERVALIREVFEFNDVGSGTIKAASVGDPSMVWGPESDYPTVDPENLPTCDVLELDCEGAETEILNQLTIRPSTIIVEVHDVDDARDNPVTDRLKEMGYEVIEFTEENVAMGCYVLYAELQEGQ